MPEISRLIRKVPGLYLNEYLTARNIDLQADLDWNAKPADLRKSLRAAINALDPEIRNVVRTDSVHIDGMTDEAGQSALKFNATCEQQEIFAEIESAHARALWMFIHDHQKFRHAEESASFDRARNKNTWDAFIAPIDLTVNRDASARKELARELADFFRNDGDIKVRVEVFDRVREDEYDGDIGLVHVVVLREGQIVSPMVFSNTASDEMEPEPELLPHKPLGEIEFTYDPVAGVIEVVAPGKEKREQLVRSFARTLLDRELSAERVPKRSYDLSVFLTERDFPTDPEDRISWVKVLLVKFVHDDGRAKVTVESCDVDETIYATAERLFKEQNPFLGGYSISEVVLAVAFKPDSINPRGRTVSAKLRDPHGCSIGETCAKERLLRRKYFRAWGIVSNMSIAA